MIRARGYIYAITDSLLTPSLTKGIRYYVSLRAVTLTGVKFDFSASFIFSL
jgi:hypothetical protein